MSRLAQLGKDAFIYGLGGILAKSLSFFLLPVYTRIFTPADYGSIEMLTVLSSFLAAILVMGMDSAQSMYFFKEQNRGKESQRRLVSAILQWRLIWGGVVVVLATLAAPILNALFFRGQLGWEYFGIAFVGILFAQVMNQSAEVMRLLYRPWDYILITLTQTVVAAGLVLLFVLSFEQGILGFFLGAGIASLVVSVFGWFRLREYLSFKRIHWDWWPQLVRFGAPLVPAGMAIYLMNTADRWFVQYYHGAEALGIFAVGAKFSLLLALGVETFRKAWWPIAMDAMCSEDGPETFRMIARLYMGVACAGVVALTFVSPWLVQWLTAPAFHDAWTIVGILAWQAVFYGFFLIASAGIWKAEKTYLNLPVMGGAAALGLILNWLLVPVMGAMGAALATAITYLAWVIVSMIISERLWKVEFDMKVLGCQIIVAIMYVSWFTFSGIRTTSHWVPLFGGLVIAAALLFFSLDIKNRNAVLKKFQNRITH